MVGMEFHLPENLKAKSQQCFEALKTFDISNSVLVIFSKMHINLLSPCEVFKFRQIWKFNR